MNLAVLLCFLVSRGLGLCFSAKTGTLASKAYGGVTVAIPDCELRRVPNDHREENEVQSD
jgi:hypothetical protein